MNWTDPRTLTEHSPAGGAAISARAMVLLVALVAAPPGVAVSAQAGADPAASKAAPANSSQAATRRTSPYKPVSVTEGARDFYRATAGVDKLKVRRTGPNLIQFRYRVTDPERAQAVHDKKATPYLIGHTSRAVLQVPVMEKVGPLRQSTRPEEGKEYWMVFSNKGDVVKIGERVSVIIGAFRVDGLKVE